MSPTGSLPYFSWFLLSYSLFAILWVVFTRFLFNDHDPSGAVTRWHKNNELSSNMIRSLAERPSKKPVQLQVQNGVTIKLSKHPYTFIAFQRESGYTLLLLLRSGTRYERALEGHRAEFVALGRDK